MLFLRFFLCVLVAALVSAALGGGFAALVAYISPEFVKTWFFPPKDASLPRYAAALGMIYGLVIGSSVMGFSLALGTLVQIARMFAKKTDDARSAS